MEARIKALSNELERISKELLMISEALAFVRSQIPDESGCDYESFVSGGTYVVVDSPTGYEVSVHGEVP